MAELDIENLLESVRRNGHEAWVAGPQSEEDIATMETALQVRLPPVFAVPYCFDARYPDAEGEFSLNCYELYSGADGKIADNLLQFIVKRFLETWLE